MENSWTLIVWPFPGVIVLDRTIRVQENIADCDELNIGSEAMDYWKN
jgi:hypothetical protein